MFEWLDQYIGRRQAAVPSFSSVNVTLSVLGHSLGGAMAQLFSVYAVERGYNVKTVVLAASVRVFDEQVEAYARTQIGAIAQHVVADIDVASSLPPNHAGYRVLQTQKPAIIVTHPESCTSCMSSLYLGSSCPEKCSSSSGISVAGFESSTLAYISDPYGASWARDRMSQVDPVTWLALHETDFLAELVCQGTGINAMHFPNSTSQFGPGQIVGE